MPNERLLALRLGSAWTQAEVAELLSDEVQRATGRRPAVDGQAISRMERGEITWPVAATRRALRVVFGVDSDADLGLFPKRTRRDAEKVAATKRRDFLTLAGLGLLDASPRMLGQPDVATMRSRFDRLRDLDNYLGGADTFRLYGTELAHTERLLNEGRYSAATRIALTELAAEQAQQAGWAAFDAGHPAPALQLFEYSRRAADDAGSSDLVANSFVHIAYASDADEATRAADAARHALPVDAAPTTLALVATRRAWSYAVAGDAQGAERALDEAWTSLESSSATDAPHWSSWVDSKEIEIMTGRVWAVLHVPDKAVPALEIALANYPDQWARDKALYSTWLADAYIDAGAIDQAASVLNHAITLADPVASVRPANRIKEVVRRLTGYDLPAVASLTERAAKINPPLVALL